MATKIQKRAMTLPCSAKKVSNVAAKLLKSLLLLHKVQCTQQLELAKENSGGGINVKNPATHAKGGKTVLKEATQFGIVPTTFRANGQKNAPAGFFRRDKFRQGRCHAGMGEQPFACQCW